MRKFRSLQDLWNSLRKLHSDETGAQEQLNTILILAFIALPLLGLLIFYRGQVVAFIKSIWQATTGSGPTDMTSGAQ